MHRRALGIALQLQDAGVAPNTLVGIVRKKGWEQIVAALGVLCAGAADLPIEVVDPGWKSIPYGRAMVNQTFHVLGTELESCPTPVAGQLYISGLGLAKGYWRDPEKTAECFSVRPLTGERLYRTGDRGRWLPDGNIEFLGREDFQVKIRGFRIEWEEIEAALRQPPGVDVAVVTAQGEHLGNKRLAAYVVPRSLLEPTVARIWAEVLHVPKVGVHDYFMDRGGDSLAAVPIVSRLNSTCALVLPVRSVFDSPPVAGLAGQMTGPGSCVVAGVL